MASVSESDTRFPVLTALLRLIREQVTLDSECCRTIGRALDQDPTDIQKVADWVTELARNDGGAVVHRCVSISCTGNGADSLWEAIGPELSALGLLEQIHPVHCLARCGEGPCLSISDQVYQGREERIYQDDRPWREAPFDQDV